MDFWSAVVLALLAFPVMALVAFVMALRQRGRIRVLEARVAALEELSGTAAALAQVPMPAPAPSASPPPEPEPGPLPIPAHDPVRPPPVFSAPQPEKPKVAGDRVAGLEERLGARWAVWVGGIALALGGVFLVRFAVEQDLIGPGLRVGLGLLVAASLLAGGEWLRRSDRRAGLPGLPAAHVPSVLTAAGTMTAFGSIYAAYELYHLIPPQAAFLLLAATAIATLLAALLHGPALAALGFVGAAVTPFLITTDDPNAWGVALLVAAVAASALGVARVRRWAWLAFLAMAGVVAWGLALLLLEVPQAVPAAGALGVVLLALTAVLLAPGLLWGPPAGSRPDPVSSLGAAGALLVTAAAAMLGDVVVAAARGGAGAAPLGVFVFVSLGVLALAWRVRPMTFAALAVALLAPAVLWQWHFPPPAGTTIAPPGPVTGAVSGPSRLPEGAFMAFAGGMAALLLGFGLAGARRGGRGLVVLGFALAGTVGPVLLLVAAYARLAGLERSLAFAALALALAVLLTWATEMLTRAGRRHGATVFAAGAVIALSLALTFALEKGWLTVSLALAALGVAWVSTRRALPGLRQFSAMLGLVVLGRIVWLPTIAGADPGGWPILNWLLWGYGVPAAAFAGAALLLAKGGDDWARRVHECLALVFAVLLAAFEVRHLAHGGDIYAPGTRLFETGLLAAIYGAYALGLARLAAATGRPLHRLFADAMGVLAGLCALAALVVDNPFQTGARVGGPVFNDLLLAYGLPAGLMLAYAAALPVTRTPLRTGALALALILGLAYLTFEVSRLFQGPVLRTSAISSAEWYAYSAAWLMLGILLLAVGLWRGSRTLRLASGAVMAATVLKVFLSDMSDLEGVLRALSFIGLGLVLVAMGWLYQRLLAREKAVG